MIVMSPNLLFPFISCSVVKANQVMVSTVDCVSCDLRWTFGSEASTLTM